ncbi:uncharacterized protein RBU33_019470 isoform 1-T1 [Hipposideros larvatus]
MGPQVVEGERSREALVKVTPEGYGTHKRLRSNQGTKERCPSCRAVPPHEQAFYKITGKQQLRSKKPKDLTLKISLRNNLLSLKETSKALGSVAGSHLCLSI